MIPALLHFVVPAKPNGRQEQAIAIARRLHPEWQFRIWHDAETVAGGRLGPYATRCGSGAQRADLIRLDAISLMGGVYLDSDIFLQRPLDFLLPLDTFVIASEDGQRASNSFFAAPPQHPATGAIVARLLDREPDWTLPPNETTGPELYSGVLHYRADVTALPRESFYPYNWNETRPDVLPPALLGIHEWSRSWHPPRQHTRRLGTADRVRATLKATARPLQPLVRRLVSAALPPDMAALPHRQARAAYASASEIITATKHGVKMALPSADLSVTPSLVLAGEFERSDEHFVLSIVRGGDWIIDVGANVGLYTLLAASRCGPFGRVFALEPNPEPASYLRRSVLMNWFQDRVRVLPLAASDDAGERTLAGPVARLGDFRLKMPDESVRAPDLLADTAAKESVELKVQAARLDDLFPYDVPIKLLKIDAEGHDAQVLRGGQRLIERRCVQYVMVEVSRDAAGTGFGDLMAELRLLTDAGYRASLSNDDGSLRPISDFERAIPSIGHVNMIFAADWQHNLSPRAP